MVFAARRPAVVASFLPVVLLAGFALAGGTPLPAQPVPPSPFGEPFLLADITPGFPGSEIGSVCPFGGAGPVGAPERLLFVTEVDRRLWATDGTPGGTRPLLPPGAQVLHIVRCTDEGGFVSDSATAAGHRQVWWTDGTSRGTYPLVDAFHPSVSEELSGGRHVILGAVATPGGGPSPQRLWVSDRTADGTVEIPLPAGPEGALSPLRLERLGDRVLFTAVRLSSEGEAVDQELWVTDGTIPGTERVGEFGPEPVDLATLRRFGDRAALLVRRNPDSFDWRLELWTSDGTAVGTRQVPVDLPEASLISARGQELDTPEGERLAFVLGSGTHVDDPQQLWVTDGAAAGTVKIAEAGRVVPGAVVPPFVGELFERDGLFYFPLDDGVDGEELWVSDLTPEGTRQVMDLCPGPCSSGARVLAHYGERVLLRASDSEVGEELWVSDLTLAGTRPVGDLCPGVCSSRPHHLLQPPGADGWTLFAARSTGFFLGREQLWELPPPDETLSPLAWPPPPRPATDFPQTDAFHPRQPISPVVALAHHVLFAHATLDHGEELWSLPLGEQAPPPPAGDPLTSAAVPGFRFWVRISAAGAPALAGRLEPACIPETACVSGAVPGRSEVFVRVVGPKPNGFLWPTLVKFTTSTVEVWIERPATDELRYYVLPGARPGVDELPGLFDRTGFPP